MTGETWKPLLSVPGGALAAERAIGRGRVIAVSDARIFTNADLGRADHSVAAFRLLARLGAGGPGRPGGPGGPVWIDEYFHGLYRAPSIVRLALGWPGLAVSVPLALVIAIWLWGQMPRFGPLRRARERSRRRREDLVEAMALVLAAGGPHTAAFDSFRDGVEEELRGMLHLGPAADGFQIREAIRATRGSEGAALARELTDAPPVRTPEALLDQCRRLDDLRKELESKY